jgi:hypothetical protein
VTIQREGDETVPCNKLMEVDNKINILQGLLLNPICQTLEQFWSHFGFHKNLILLFLLFMHSYTMTGIFYNLTLKNIKSTLW